MIKGVFFGVFLAIFIISLIVSLSGIFPKQPVTGSVVGDVQWIRYSIISLIFSFVIVMFIVLNLRQKLSSSASRAYKESALPALRSIKSTAKQTTIDLYRGAKRTIEGITDASISAGQFRQLSGETVRGWHPVQNAEQAVKYQTLRRIQDKYFEKYDVRIPLQKIYEQYKDKL